MTTLSLTQQYAEQQRPTIVPRMLAAIEQVRRNTTWIARGALAVTTPHQVLFIGSLAHGGSVLDIITAWFFALLIPALTDLGMLTMLRVTQTTGMRRPARRRAMAVLVVLVIESATVNALAPGHPIFRVLVAAVAVLLAAVEWVASAMGPDFAAMESAEGEIAAIAAPAADPAEAQRKADRNARERERRQARREQAAAEALAAAEAAEAKRERRRLARQVRQLEAAVAAPSATDAPVSPAGDEWRQYP